MRTLWNVDAGKENGTLAVVRSGSTIYVEVESAEDSAGDCTLGWYALTPKEAREVADLLCAYADELDAGR